MDGLRSEAMPEGWRVSRVRLVEGYESDALQAIRKLPPNGEHVLVAFSYADLLRKVRATEGAANQSAKGC